MKASSLSHHLASAARSDRGHSFILLKDDGDQGRSRAERRLLPNSRLHGSYPESACEEVIEAYRRGRLTEHLESPKTTDSQTIPCYSLLRGYPNSIFVP